MPPTAPSSVMESARNAMLARGQPLNFGSHFGVNKHMPLPAGLPYAPTNPLPKPYLDLATHPSAAAQAPLPFRSSVSEAYLQMKYGSLQNLALPPEPEPTSSTNGLAELERVFGDTNANYLKSSGSSSHKAHDLSCDSSSFRGPNKYQHDQDDSECSDIDCEHVDEDDVDVDKKL